MRTIICLAAVVALVAPAVAGAAIRRPPHRHAVVVKVAKSESGGFTGTAAQSAAAAYIAGLQTNSPQWVTAVQTADANGGVIPGLGQ